MIRISVWKKCHCDYYYYYCNFTFIENRHLWLYIYRFEDMRKRQRYLCARDIGLAGRYWYSCRNIYGLFWTYDKLHIIVFIVMKMIIMLGGMLHPISLRSDKLVSRGCIQLFFFALFCSHTFMYYTIFFFVKSNIWYSFGTYCEKGALLFSLCKCILLKLNTHCIQVGEAPKKGNGKYTKRHCETKTHQNGYHVDIRIVANRITFKRNGLNVQTNGKNMQSFLLCMPIWISVL